MSGLASISSSADDFFNVYSLSEYKQPNFQPLSKRLQDKIIHNDTYLETETRIDQDNSRRPDGTIINLGLEVLKPFTNNGNPWQKELGFPLGSLSLDKKVLEHPTQVAIQTEIPNSRNFSIERIRKSLNYFENPNSRKSSIESMLERRRSLNDIETPQKGENRRMTTEEQKEHAKRLKKGLSPKRQRGRRPNGFYRE